MLNVADLRLALPRHQPVLFALTQGTTTTDHGPRTTDQLRLIPPELLPLLAELGFEADLFLIHAGALLPVALDLCSVYGEGLLLETTDHGPRTTDHSRHVWATVMVMVSSPLVSSPVVHSATFFARSHTTGLQAECSTTDPAVAARFCADLAERRKFIRQGAEAMSYAHTTEAGALWQAAVEELDFRAGIQPWNVELGSTRAPACPATRPRVADPEVFCAGAENNTRGACAPLSVTLTGFDAHGRLPEAIVAGLPSLDGLRPEDILLPKVRREFVTQALSCPVLRIEPALRETLRATLDQCASNVLKAGIKRHHWQRYRELRKVDASKARYHLRLAQSVQAA